MPEILIYTVLLALLGNGTSESCAVAYNLERGRSLIWKRRVFQAFRAIEAVGLASSLQWNKIGYTMEALKQKIALARTSKTENDL